MRSYVWLAVGAAATLTAVPPSSTTAQDLGDVLKRGHPERVLTCSDTRPEGCDVSCVTTSATVLFVHGGVRNAFITEFAGSHTLLELQKTTDEIVSVLVGDISHCTFNGMRDPALASRGPGPGK